MDYPKLVKAAGLKGDVADFVSRKLASRQVPKEKLNNLHDYFPRTTHLGGMELSELGSALYGAAVEMEKPKTKKTADTAVSEDK